MSTKVITSAHERSKLPITRMLERIQHKSRQILAQERSKPTMPEIVRNQFKTQVDVLLALTKVWNLEQPPTLGLLADAAVFYRIAPGATGHVEARLTHLLENFAKCDPLWAGDQLEFLQSELELVSPTTAYWMDCHNTAQYLKTRLERRERELRQAITILAAELGRAA